MKAINPTQELSDLGVSIWLDDLNRESIESGGLHKFIDEMNVVGVTTNPTIFAAAVAGSHAYNGQLMTLAEAGASPAAAVVELTTDDVAKACDILKPIYKKSNGFDGRVSIEVNPSLAYDILATVEQAKALYKKVDRENMMVKIPATAEGLEAITVLTAAGISINATLIFSIERYREVVRAYLTGLEKAQATGLELSRIHSVASFFISRLDTEIDERLVAIGTNEAHELRTKAGVANARLAHEVHVREFHTERAKRLLESGANIQRLLWASTGVKAPAVPESFYVVELAAPGVVNTMPEYTLEAIFRQGAVRGNTIESGYVQAAEIMEALSKVGISYRDTTALLEEQGIEKFKASWNELLDTVSTAIERLGHCRPDPAKRVPDLMEAAVTIPAGTLPVNGGREHL